MASSEWVAPKDYKIDSEKEVAELVSEKNINTIIDPIDYVAEDLFELYNPDKIDNPKARAQFCAEVKNQGVKYGRWFHYSYDNSLVRFPEEEEYYNLRTFRNRNLITYDEQRRLRKNKIAVFGLSVGSNIVDSAVQTGIGNEYLLFDPDRLSPTNLNRIRANMGHIGLQKTTVAGRKMAELDPYIAQQHFVDGYNQNTDDILFNEMPDIIIEEADDVEVKARVRRIAKKLGIMVLTVGDIGDKLVLDVERYDQENVEPFNGKISAKEFEALVEDKSKISNKDRETMLMKMLGLKNMSTRLIDSSMVRNIELAGFPQLGTTAAMGGVAVAVAMRDILLDRKVNSGTRVGDIRKIVKSGKPTTIVETVDTIKRFIKYRRNNG